MMQDRHVKEITVIWGPEEPAAQGNKPNGKCR